MTTATLRWSAETVLKVHLPANWRIAAVLSPAEPRPLTNLPHRLTQAMDSPLAGPPLRKLIDDIAASRPTGGRVAIVVDDATRNTPVADILPQLLRYLRDAGVADERITIAVATGMHPPLEPAELACRLGSAADRLRVVQNDCYRRQRYRYFGRTDSSVPVWLLREVAEAELRILIGSVLPHLQAGFSAGLKLLWPGCAYVDTIARLHMAGLAYGPPACVGQMPESNAMHQQMCRARQLIGGRDFAVFVLLDSAGRVCRIACGRPQPAQKRLAELAQRYYSDAVDGPVDVALVSSFPRDADLVQAFKAVVHVASAVRPGGVIAAVMNVAHPRRIRNPLPVFPSAATVRRLVRLFSVDAVAELLGKLAPQLNHEARFFVRLALKTIARSDILIYSPPLTQAGATFPCVRMFSRMPVLLRQAERLLGCSASGSVGRPADDEGVIFAATASGRPIRRVLVAPQGGANYPRLVGPRAQAAQNR